MNSFQGSWGCTLLPESQFSCDFRPETLRKFDDYQYVTGGKLLSFSVRGPKVRPSDFARKTRDLLRIPHISVKSSLSPLPFQSLDWKATDQTDLGVRGRTR